MPTFVIHSMGKPVQKASVDRPQIQVGRNPKCDLVLPGGTVSREHAAFLRDPAGRWHVRCLSDTNPIVVDGALITQSALVSEGSEVLVGGEFLVIFSENEVKAQAYMGQKSHFAKSQCAQCGWTGMVSALRREPVCPKCASVNIRSMDQYSKTTAQQEAVVGDTMHISQDQVRASLKKLKAAKLSRLERIDGHEDRTQRIDLSESESIQIGKTPQSTFKLRGFSLGSGVTIRWRGTHFIAESTMIFPGMKVNGVKMKSAPLNSGDVIEVGGNRFRLVTE